MNGRLLLQTLRWNRVKLAAIIVAAFAWGLFIPIIYVSFGQAFKDLADSGVIPKQLMNFGSGSLFTLSGALTLGLQHPLAIAFLGLFAIGSTVGAVAGEREHGTLEVLLARPISRRTLYVTLAVAVLILLALVLAALLSGELAGVAINGLTDEIDASQLPLAYANGLLLWCAFAAFGLAASVSFDRVAPALGLSLAYLLANYFLEILGSLWTDVAWSQQYSLIHQFQPGDILEGNVDPIHFLVLGVAVVVPVVYALIVFPRRDLAAPA